MKKALSALPFWRRLPADDRRTLYEDARFWVEEAGMSLEDFIADLPTSGDWGYLFE